MNARAVTSDVLLGMIPIVLLVAVWQALVSFGYAPVTLLPPPGQVFLRMMQQLVDRDVPAGDRGHAIPAVCGIFDCGDPWRNRWPGGGGQPSRQRRGAADRARAGTACRRSRSIRRCSCSSASATSPRSLLVTFDALFPILLATYYGASTVEQKLIWSAMAAGTPPREILFKVVLPAAAPSILTGCRIGLVISCIVVFLAEMITSTDGLGHVLVTAARTFQAVDMFVPLITISLLGLDPQRPA